jgi:hypothetical protein
MGTGRRAAGAGALIGLLALCLLTSPLRAGPEAARPAAEGASGASTPPWRLTSYRHIGFDRSFKADLVDLLPEAPRLVVFGGSRAMRFEPSYFAEHATLPAFNAAVQNCRPEDAFALSSYLFARAPDVRLDCFFAVQTATFADAPLHPGLLYDERLSRAFPAALVARQKAALGKPPIEELLGANRFSSRGLLRRNSYDIGRARPGYSLSRRLDGYILRLLPKYRWTGRPRETRSRAYFEMTMRLFNDHGVIPAVVLMPYHPRALRAFRAVGWQRKLDELTAYLRDAQSRCDFRVLNLVSIASFGGRSRWFYDGAHVTRENARLIVRHALRVAPECFR